MWSFDQFPRQTKERSDFVAVDQTTIEFAHGLNGFPFFPFIVKHEPKCFCCVPPQPTTPTFLVKFPCNITCKILVCLNFLSGRLSRISSICVIDLLYRPLELSLIILALFYFNI